MWKFLLLFLLCTGALAAEYQVAAFTDNFVVHTADGTFAGQDKFLASLNDRIDALQMSTGVYLDIRAEIYVVASRAEYQKLAQGKNSIVEFSDAFYSSREKRIYIRSADQIWENYGGVIVHEYVHWFLEEILMGAPLWFHEGMATMQGGQLGMDRYLYYVRERFWGNKMDLFQLAYDYPEQRKDWEMYYLSSYFAVKYMQDKDASSWRNFWGYVAANYRQGQKTRFTAALAGAYQTTLYDFNTDFAAASKKQAYIYLIIGINSILFSLLPIVVVIAMLKRRKKMRELPDLELPEDEIEPEDEEDDETKTFE